MNDTLSFLLNAFLRSFAVAGYSFFGMSGGLIIAGQMSWNVALIGAFFAGGGYFFTELIRNQKIDVSQINKKGSFKFLLFP
jgi:hypothetical protein